MTENPVCVCFRVIDRVSAGGGYSLAQSGRAGIFMKVTGWDEIGEAACRREE